MGYMLDLQMKYIIRNSIIIDNSNCGLHIEYSDGSIYEYNIFRNNSWWDFYMEFSLFCEIRYNAFLYTRTGVRTETCSNNEFYSNEFRGHNHYGIHLVRDCYLQPRNKIHHNNFFDNCVDARFQDCKNVWYHNYWNCSHIVHVIWGGRYLILSSKASIFLPMWEFDLFPVDEHYDIVV